MFGRKYQRDRKKKLLYEIFKAGGSLAIVFIAPGAAPTILKPFMDSNNLTNPELKRTLRKMNEDGLISMKESKDGKITVRLKKDGKEKALKYSIEEMDIKKPKKWDKKWRIVIFDIPEKKKLARDILQQKLRELGFKKIQNSIYVYPFPCEDEIEFISSVYEIRPYVQLMRADKVSNEELLKAHFKI